MKIKASQFIGCTFLLTVALILPVPLCDMLVSGFFTKTAAPAGFPLKETLVGICSESIRAVITCYLYTMTTGKGSSLSHGMKHGLLYSALIGSLYLILGAFYFQLSDPVRFLVTDSLILLIQGFTSGFVLYVVFKEKR